MGRGGPQPNYQIRPGDLQVEAAQVDIEDPEAFPFDDNAGGFNVYLVNNDLAFNDDVNDSEEESLSDPEDPEAELEENNGRHGCCGNCNNNAVLREQRVYCHLWWMSSTHSEVKKVETLDRLIQSKCSSHSENHVACFNNNNDVTLNYERAGEDNQKKGPIQGDHGVNLSMPLCEQLNMNQSMGGALGTQSEKDSHDAPGEGRRPQTGDGKSGRRQEAETSVGKFQTTFVLPRKTVAPSNIRDAGLQVDLCQERFPTERDIHPDVIAANCGFLKIIEERQGRVGESVWSDEMSTADDPDRTTVSCFSSTLCNVDIVMVGASPDVANSRDVTQIDDICEKHHEIFQFNQPVQQKEHVDLEYLTNNVRTNPEKKDFIISNLKLNDLFRNFPVDIGCTPSSEYDFGTYFLQHNCLEKFGLPRGNSLIPEIVRSKSEWLLPSRDSDSLWLNVDARNSSNISLRPSQSECNSTASRNRKEIISKCIKEGLISELGMSSQSIQHFNNTTLQDLKSGQYERTHLQGQPTISTIPPDCQLALSVAENSTSNQIISVVQSPLIAANTSLGSSGSGKTQSQSSSELDLLYQRLNHESFNPKTFAKTDEVVQDESLQPDCVHLPVRPLSCSGINSIAKPQTISWSKCYLPNLPEESVQFLDTFKPLSVKEQGDRGFNVPSASPHWDRTFNVPSANPQGDCTCKMPSASPHRDRTFNVPSASPNWDRTFNVPSSSPHRDRTFNVQSASPQRDRTLNLRSNILQCESTSLNTSQSFSNTIRTYSKDKISKFRLRSLKEESENLTINRTTLSPDISYSSSLTVRDSGEHMTCINSTTSIVDLRSSSPQRDRTNVLSLPVSFNDVIRSGDSQNTQESCTTKQLHGQTVLQTSCTSFLPSLAEVALLDETSSLILMSGDAGHLQEFEPENKFQSESPCNDISDITISFVTIPRDDCNQTTAMRDMNSDMCSCPDIFARKLSINSSPSQLQMPTSEFRCQTQDLKSPETPRCSSNQVTDALFGKYASGCMERYGQTGLISAQNLEQHSQNDAETIALTNSLSFSTTSGKELHYNTGVNGEIYVVSHYDILEDTSSGTLIRPDLSAMQETSSSLQAHAMKSEFKTKSLPVINESSLDGNLDNSKYTHSSPCVSDTATCSCPHCCRRRMMESSGEATRSNSSEPEIVTNTPLHGLLSSTATSNEAVGAHCDKIESNDLDCTHSVISDKVLSQPAETGNTMYQPSAITDNAMCQSKAATDNAICQPKAATDSAIFNEKAVTHSVMDHPTAVTDTSTCHPIDVKDGNMYKPYLKSHNLGCTGGSNLSIFSNIILAPSVSSVQSDPSMVVSLSDVSHCRTNQPIVSIATKPPQDIPHIGLRENVHLNSLNCETNDQVNITRDPNVLNDVTCKDSRSRDKISSKDNPGMLDNHGLKDIPIPSAECKPLDNKIPGRKLLNLRKTKDESKVSSDRTDLVITKTPKIQISENPKNDAKSKTSVTVEDRDRGSATVSTSKPDGSSREKANRKRCVLPAICDKPRQTSPKKNLTLKLPKIRQERKQSVKKPSEIVALPEIEHNKNQPQQSYDLGLGPPLDVHLLPHVGLGSAITADVLLNKFRESQREKIRQKRSKFIDKVLNGQNKERLVHECQNTEQNRERNLDSKLIQDTGTSSKSQSLCSKPIPTKDCISNSQKEYLRESLGNEVRLDSHLDYHHKVLDNDTSLDSKSPSEQTSSQGASCSNTTDSGLTTKLRLSSTDFKPWPAKISVHKRKRSILKSKLTKVPEEEFSTSDKTPKAVKSSDYPSLRKKVSPWRKNVTFEAQNSSSTGNTWAVQDDLANQTARESAQRTSRSSNSQSPRRSKSANVHLNDISSSRRIASDSSMGQCNTLEEVEALAMDATSTVSELPSSKTSLLSDAGEMWHQLSQGDSQRGKVRTDKPGDGDVLAPIMKCPNLPIQETNILVYNTIQVQPYDLEQHNQDAEGLSQQRVSTVDSKDIMEELAAEQTFRVEETNEELSAVQTDTSAGSREINSDNKTYTIEPRIKEKKITFSSVETKLPNKSMTSVTDSGISSLIKARVAGDKGKKKASLLAERVKNGAGGKLKVSGGKSKTCPIEPNKPPRVIAESHYYRDSNTVNVVVKPINMAADKLKVKVQFCETNRELPNESDQYRKTRFSEQFNKSLIHFSQSYNKQSDAPCPAFMSTSRDKDQNSSQSFFPVWKSR